MTADANGRPPLTSPDTHARIAQLCADAQRLAVAEAAPKPILLGRHLIQLGQKPGPAFTPLLDAAFEAQLDGTFADQAGAVAWVRQRLENPDRN
jgi:tRNA nucleotidyltransferase (CCA-adding enzyme)